MPHHRAMARSDRLPPGNLTRSVEPAVPAIDGEARALVASIGRE
jgi:hypothetical protein